MSGKLKRKGRFYLCVSACSLSGIVGLFPKTLHPLQDDSGASTDEMNINELLHRADGTVYFYKNGCFKQY